jgi:DNA-binding response OmpR family regulator
MKKILIVDDERDFCSTIKEELEVATSFAVDTCSNGAVAFDRVKSAMPDLILLDVMMPQMSGPEIARQLKNCEETKGIPIIFLTGVVDEEEAEKHKHVIGGEYFLGKPVKIEELLYMINRLIG